MRNKQTTEHLFLPTQGLNQKQKTHSDVSVSFCHSLKDTFFVQCQEFALVSEAAAHLLDRMQNDSCFPAVSWWINTDLKSFLSVSLEGTRLHVMLFPVLLGLFVASKTTAGCFSPKFLRASHPSDVPEQLNRNDVMLWGSPNPQSLESNTSRCLTT